MASRAHKKRLIILFISAIVVAIPVGVFIIGEYSLFPKISSTDGLKSMPYLTWHPAEDTIEKIGVIKYDRTKSFEGINIYVSEVVCYLVDMSGNILHTWSTTGHNWHYAVICRNGDLLAICKDGSLARLDWDSNIKWIKKRMKFYHDIAIAENNDIYTLVNKKERVFRFGVSFLIKNYYIVVLSPDGEIKRKISLYNVFKNKILVKGFGRIYRWIISPRKLLRAVRQKGESVFYSTFKINSLSIINRNIETLCRKEDLLFCAYGLDLIGILDIKKKRLIWSWGPGNLDRPHHPTLLENGNILIFDNGSGRKYSRIVEINPLTKDIVWEYKSNPPSQFYSGTGGACQRLPNGNTLITETDKGHVFEITSGGEIVWEFYNPEIRKDARKRAAIYRMMRITDPENYPCLEAIIEPK